MSNEVFAILTSFVAVVVLIVGLISALMYNRSKGRR